MFSQMQTAEYESHPMWLGCCHTYVFIGMLMGFYYAQEHRAGLPWLYNGAALRVYAALCHQPEMSTCTFQLILFSLNCIVLCAREAAIAYTPLR